MKPKWSCARELRPEELDSFLPLANLLDESDRTEEAEQLYREAHELGDAFLLSTCTWSATAGRRKPLNGCGKPLQAEMRPLFADSLIRDL
jgi:hypothetical protein